MESARAVLGITTPLDSSVCPQAHGLLQAPGQGWECSSQQEQTTAPGKGLVFQTINAHRTLAPCSNDFLKNEVSLPKVLEICSDDPESCCALLVSRDAHRMGGFRFVF